MWKTFLAGAIRSKTVNVNTFATVILLTVVKYYDIQLTPDEAMAYTGLAYAIINLILRTVTGKTLPEKGLEVKLPKYTDVVVARVTELIEARQPSKEEIAEAVISNLAEKSRAIRKIVDS